MSEFTWTTNDFELSEYLTSNDNRMLPTAFTEGEIIREINSLEKKYAALKDEIRRHEKVFQFSAERIAALKRKVELAIERIRAEDDPDIGKPWIVEHVLAILTAEEQRSETE